MGRAKCSSSRRFPRSDSMTRPISRNRIGIAFVTAIILFLFPSVYWYLMSIAVICWFVTDIRFPLVGWIGSISCFQSHIGWYLVLTASVLSALRIFVYSIDHTAQLASSYIGLWSSGTNVGVVGIAFLKIMGGAMILGVQPYHIDRVNNPCNERNLRRSSLGVLLCRPLRHKF
jgi:hypothetical protein